MSVTGNVTSPRRLPAESLRQDRGLAARIDQPVQYGPIPSGIHFSHWPIPREITSAVLLGTCSLIHSGWASADRLTWTTIRTQGSNGLVRFQMR